MGVTLSSVINKGEQFFWQVLALMSPAVIWRNWRKSLSIWGARDLLHWQLKANIGLALWIVLLTFYVGFFLYTPSVNTIFEVIIVKLIVCILASIYSLLIGFLPYIWLEMIPAVPKTMARFVFVRILVTKILRLVRTLDRPLPRLAMMEQQRSPATVPNAWSAIFHTNKFPYSLFPIKNSLFIPEPFSH